MHILYTINCDRVVVPHDSTRYSIASRRFIWWWWWWLSESNQPTNLADCLVIVVVEERANYTPYPQQRSQWSCAKLRSRRRWLGQRGKPVFSFGLTLARRGSVSEYAARGSNLVLSIQFRNLKKNPADLQEQQKNQTWLVFIYWNSKRSLLKPQRKFYNYVKVERIVCKGVCMLDFLVVELAVCECVCQRMRMRYFALGKWLRRTTTLEEDLELYTWNQTPFKWIIKRVGRIKIQKHRHTEQVKCLATHTT